MLFLSIHRALRIVNSKIISEDVAEKNVPLVPKELKKLPKPATFLIVT
jgi:hypothetical protein